YADELRKEVHFHLGPLVIGVAAQQDFTCPFTKVLPTGLRSLLQRLFLGPREPRSDTLSAGFPAFSLYGAILCFRCFRRHLLTSDLHLCSRFQMEPRKSRFSPKSRPFFLFPNGTV